MMNEEPRNQVFGKKLVINKKYFKPSTLNPQPLPHDFPNHFDLSIKHDRTKLNDWPLSAFDEGHWWRMIFIKVNRHGDRLILACEPDSFTYKHNRHENPDESQ